MAANSIYAVKFAAKLVMIRYQDFNFDTIPIRYFENIAISILMFLK